MKFRNFNYPDVKLSCNTENMTRFVKALESGNYAINQGNLQSIVDGTSRYCCLGVACDVSGLGSWEKIGIQAGYVVESVEFPERFYLPIPVMEWLGVDDIPNGWGLRVSGDYEGDLNETLDQNTPVPYVTAALLNDYGFSFAEIASVLRRVYLSEDFVED